MVIAQQQPGRACMLELVARRAAPAPDADDDLPAGEWALEQPTALDPTLPAERRFLDHLGQHPDDAGMRMVFADWLEETAQHDKAALLRMVEDPGLADSKDLREASDLVDDTWLTTISRAPIDGCDVELRFRCPKSWSSLTPADAIGIRFCNACERNVYFCTTLAEVRERGRARECVAFSSALVRQDALEVYAEEDLLLMGEVAYDEELPS
jgi:uncharacterized protein (TIGR02996 family)